jgi:hypothetical protein
MLDKTYFRDLGETGHDYDHTYHCFELLRSGVVLFNTKTQEPFACVMFQAHADNIAYAPDGSNNNACASQYAPLALFPRSDSRLQVVVGAEGQYWEVVITNLTGGATAGMMNINLMRADLVDKSLALVRENDPPGGVNCVNELQPGHSWQVFSDHTAGDTKMVLSCVIEGAAADPVTMRQDDAEWQLERKPQAASCFWPSCQKMNRV